MFQECSTLFSETDIAIVNREFCETEDNIHPYNMTIQQTNIIAPPWKTQSCHIFFSPSNNKVELVLLFCCISSVKSAKSKLKSQFLFVPLPCHIVWQVHFAQWQIPLKQICCCKKKTESVRPISNIKFIAFHTIRRHMVRSLQNGTATIRMHILWHFLFSKRQSRIKHRVFCCFCCIRIPAYDRYVSKHTIAMPLMRWVQCILGRGLPVDSIPMQIYFASRTCGWWKMRNIVMFI